ncbi:ankyrin repeat domain-containing protein 17-like [Formica exsecta]|uniref:ankyrin repeat domain-containing protein 17-like n=1 Tax=Formica exsecta TaxID=72781 RepID=UPI0011417DA3|nr:ankyrin repeat domain-containing protein 17-like [Formica exsecta]
MQNIMQGTISDSQKSHEEQSAAPAAASVYYETEKTSWTPQWPNWSATETETLREWQPNFITDCLAREEDVSEVSLAMNANVEDCGIAGDCTLLMRAAKAGCVNLVKWLINHGIDVNTQSTFGNTPLMYGCAGGHEEVVRVLLEAGTNVEDHNDLYGHTPLMEAASTGRVQIAKILLEHGAGINTHSNGKESALSLASRHGHLKMFHFLLKAGADQIQQSQQPQTQSQPHSTQLMSHPTHHHLHCQKPAQEIVCSAVDMIIYLKLPLKIVKMPRCVKSRDYEKAISNVKEIVPPFWA